MLSSVYCIYHHSHLILPLRAHAPISRSDRSSGFQKIRKYPVASFHRTSPWPAVSFMQSNLLQYWLGTLSEQMKRSILVFSLQHIAFKFYLFCLRTFMIVHFATLGDCANESLAAGRWWWPGATAVQITTQRVDTGHCKWVDTRGWTLQVHIHLTTKQSSTTTSSEQLIQDNLQVQWPAFPAWQNEALRDLCPGGAHHLSHGWPATVLHPKHVPGGSNNICL